MRYLLLLIKDNYTEAHIIKLTDKEHLYLLYLKYKITFWNFSFWKINIFLDTQI